MPTAKKLPSGSWRVRVYSHKENGKEVFKSFTASTKKEAELMALEWKNGKRHTTSLKVSEAIAGYIKAKTPVLSPSTVRGYNGMAERYFSYINDEKLDALTTEKLQLFVSNLAERVSPKTVRNVHGFLMSVIGFYLPDRAFKVTLPQMYKAITSAPSDGEISALYEGGNDTLKICIALSAFGSLRRGEISALKYGDIRPGAVYIHADFVKDTDGVWIYKPPKKPDSVRLAPLPQAVIDMLGQGDPDDFIIKWKPDTITKRFIEHRNNYNTSIRFHDLRHYYASIGAVLGIPSNYLESFGGWAQGGKTMKEVYQNNIIPMSDLYARKMTEHFDKLISEKHDMKPDTAKKKAAK